MVAGKLGAGEPRDHTGRLAAVDAPDPGVSMARAQKIGVALAGTIDVGRVVTLAGDETMILFAAHRRADSGRAHGGLLPRLERIPFRLKLECALESFSGRIFCG